MTTTAAARTCPACYAGLSDRAAFCPRCGAGVPRPASAARKAGSVLLAIFGRILGFVALVAAKVAARHDPAVAFAILAIVITVVSVCWIAGKAKRARLQRPSHPRFG